MVKEKILIIQKGGLGDNVLALPFIYELKKQQPDAELYFLMYETYEKRKVIYPTFLKLIKKEEAVKILFSKIYFLGTHKAEKDLSAFNYKKSFILTSRKMQFFINGLFGTKTTYFFEHKKPYYQNCLDILGVKNYSLPKNLFKIKQLNSKQKIITVFPTTSSPERDWSAKNYIFILNKIASKHADVKIIICSDKTNNAVRQILQSNPSFHGVTSKPLKTVITLIANSDIIISSDSGPAQISGLLNKKTLLFYEKKKTPKFLPPGKNNSIIIKETIKEITITEAYEQIAKHLPKD